MKIIKYRDKFIGIDESQVIGRIALITRCTCFDLQDKYEHNPVFSITDSLEDEDGNMEDMEIADDIDILQNMLNFETVNRLQEALQALKSPAKEIVMFKYFDDMTNVAIADMLNMNASTVGTILQRSLKKMRKILKEYYHDKS